MNKLTQIGLLLIRYYFIILFMMTELGLYFKYIFGLKSLISLLKCIHILSDTVFLLESRLNMKCNFKYVGIVAK
jgi:hypothetical protein